MLKYKKVVWVASAVLFLLVLFLIKNTTIFKKATGLIQNKQGELVYAGTVEDLIQNDTDGDGISDWKESLYGLDPTKKETTPGIPDSVVLNKITGQKNNMELTDGDNTADLTETDKFGRELLTTVISLSQNGTLDQSTIEKISTSLAEKIKNPKVRKIFLFSDIKITKNDLLQNTKDYKTAIIKIFEKYTMPSYTTADVLEKFIVDQNNVDPSVLVELDPIVEIFKKRITAVAATSVPASLALAHLDLLNAMERVVENTSDIKLYSTDPIVSMGAISQYEKNIISFDSAISNLENTVNQRLGN